MSSNFGRRLNTENSNVLELIVSLHSGKRTALVRVLEEVYSRDNWRKLTEDTINRGVGRIKRNGQG